MHKLKLCLVALFGVALGQFLNLQTSPGQTFLRQITPANYPSSIFPAQRLPVNGLGQVK